MGKGGCRGVTVLLVFLWLAGGPPVPVHSQEPALVGEVVAVDAAAGNLEVRTPDGVGRVLRLAPGAVVRRDGRPSSLWALRPVAPGFCQEVRLWLDEQGRVAVADGTYPGSEGRVVAVEGESLTYETPEGEVVRRPLASGCAVQRAGRWREPDVLRPGEWVYVLLDLDGRVKKVACSAGDSRDNAM